ncbi:MAG TPA: GNAT family N-acetyltransferase [Bryobacteraceae bacterium]|jgi:GNAT superfamily N-acetyltransferase|nr:GNAT family N-acetyltransferase [Bryobacteraceae bacterium]
MEMEIREATVSDLPAMETTARLFYASSSQLRRFEIGRFCETWRGLLENGAGVIFGLFGDEVMGALGGVRHRDPYSEEMIAAEMFWFVRPEVRGPGLRLYRAFEAWARAVGCNQIRMAFLEDSMPEKVEAIYLRLGFHPVEKLYAKELAC